MTSLALLLVTVLMLACVALATAFPAPALLVAAWCVPVACGLSRYCPPCVS